jgi:hypothetical protein
MIDVLIAWMNPPLQLLLKSEINTQVFDALVLRSMTKLFQKRPLSILRENQVGTLIINCKTKVGCKELV